MVLVVCFILSLTACGPHDRRGSSFTSAQGVSAPLLTGEVQEITGDFASMSGVTIFTCRVRSQSDLAMILARMNASLSSSNPSVEARYQLLVNRQPASSQSNYYRQNEPFNAYFAFKGDLAPHQEILVELVADFQGLRRGDIVSVYGNYIATNTEAKANIGRSGGTRHYVGN